MKLTREGIKAAAAWEGAGIRLPRFDIEKMLAATENSPEWVHFGAGNIFRGFIGSLSQRLLNDGLTETGIIAVETFDYDIIDRIYKPHDNLTLNVTMNASSELDIEVLGGIAFGIKSDELDRLRDIFAKESLKMVSYTITEKGYAIRGLDGKMTAAVENDIKNGPAAPVNAMSVTAALLLHRYNTCAAPLAVVSMDNCSHNGEKLCASVTEIAKAWVDGGFADEGFLKYIGEKVTFPWSMIDKITPRPAEEVKAVLEKRGIEEQDIFVTSKNTYIAPFVNAEAAQYLVIEDSFPNGRPALEKAGVYMTTRETVNKSETMKVTTCLNPLHTALAVYGCLLGYKTIWEEMRDAELVKLVKRIAGEGIKVVVDPKIISPADFSREVIEERLPNPNIPDAPQRIATDTSQKVGIRYGETIKAYLRSEELDASELEAIPAAIAGWLRYLLAVDDEGNSITLSSDPMIGELSAKLAGIKFGSPESASGRLTEILSNATLFGTDLYAAGIGQKTEALFGQMLEGRGAVRRVLKAL